MHTVTTIGLDIAKSVFQVHGIDAAGQVVIRRQLKRRFVLSFFEKLPPCLVGIEACASSHHWSRELQALGHTVRLMPPAYVKPYVKRQKNDCTDAEAICEAVTRPNMRFVPTKTVEQQSCLMLHRARHLFIRQQTAVINSIRAYLAEFGIVASVGRRGVEHLLEVVADADDHRLPEVARMCLAALGSQLRALKAQILEFDRRIMAWHRSNATSKRLDAIPGVGPALATALVASIADPNVFRSGRDFSAWAGAEAELERGQGQAWQYQQAGRSLFAQPVHGRRARRDPLCQDPWHPASALAHRVAGAQTHQNCRHRARQQTRQDGLGDDGQMRALQGTRRTRGVNEIAPETPA
jgi:transposase